MQDAATPDAGRNKGPVLALVVSLALLMAVGGALAWFLWPAGKSPTPTDVRRDSVTAPTTTAAVPPAATTTAPGTAADTTSTTQGRMTYRRGETIRLFLDDEVVIWDKDYPAFRVVAKKFTDSRCPAGAQCVWAGERGVELEVAPSGAETLPQTVNLGLTTRRTAEAFGLKLALMEIDDGKGGTYADVKFE